MTIIDDIQTEVAAKRIVERNDVRDQIHITPSILFYDHDGHSQMLYDEIYRRLRWAGLLVFNAEIVLKSSHGK